MLQSQFTPPTGVTMYLIEYSFEASSYFQKVQW